MTGFSILPLGMEIIVEETYPLDPSTGASFTFVMNQVMGVVCIVLAGELARPLESPDIEIEV